MKRKQQEDDGVEKAVSTTTVVATSSNTMSIDQLILQSSSKLSQKQDYIFHGGRRHVRPYYFEFISHVNKRWTGKTIVDLFADEFKGRPRDYYVGAVKSGRIKVDGEIVPVSYIVKSSQKITHFLHRHEPPVMIDDVVILHQEPDVVTVCKPASVPVHPCGQYRKNTVVGILDAEHDLGTLFPIHRLDRLVSGLLIIARTAAKADFFRQQIEGGLVKKRYIAKVIGVFPEDEMVVDANINYNGSEGRSTAEDAISSGDDKKVKGKPACTKFTRIATNGTHSLVSCEPVTGRTHQIILRPILQKESMRVRERWSLQMTTCIPVKISASIQCAQTAQS
ncbi:PREDICTED: RNA pseudouridine synthase 7 isoform X2 [Camelina sativa]|uniref:RNA pseudouridine synthase 7 isoform X2 n=1 Tax=Camelina sativa TaxID=90675 RepID=A0ABM0X8X6_CAMSA|nr:PREDICTED: RNA pseudouridine synthase 7 isoform X2 [Camelina sativa]